MISLNEIQARQQQDSSAASLMYDKPLQTKKGNLINLDQYSLALQPYEKVVIYASMKTILPEKVEEHLEIMVQDGMSQYF